MPQYRKKPVVIEAWQFLRPDDPEWTAMPEWLRSAMNAGAVWYQGGDEPYLTIRTLEGEMKASVFDWVIQGVKGEIYPCKPAIFSETYDLAD